MLNDLSQYLHLYGCSPVCVLRWRVRLAERGKTFPQNLHPYLSLILFPEEEYGKDSGSLSIMEFNVFSSFSCLMAPNCPMAAATYEELLIGNREKGMNLDTSWSDCWNFSFPKRR